MDAPHGQDGEQNTHFSADTSEASTGDWTSPRPPLQQGAGQEFQLWFPGSKPSVLPTALTGLRRLAFEKERLGDQVHTGGGAHVPGQASSRVCQMLFILHPSKVIC